MMKITFLAINYAPSVGGAQQLVQRIAEGLVQRHGHQVTVVTTDALYAPAGKNPGKIPIDREVIAGVEVLRLPPLTLFALEDNQSIFARTHRLLCASHWLGMLSYNQPRELAL